MRSSVELDCYAASNAGREVGNISNRQLTGSGAGTTLKADLKASQSDAAGGPGNRAKNVAYTVVGKGGILNTNDAVRSAGQHPHVGDVNQVGAGVANKAGCEAETHPIKVLQFGEIQRERCSSAGTRPGNIGESF